MIKIINNFCLPLALAASNEWPSGDWPHWHLYDGNNSVKRASKDHYRLTPACKLLIAKMAETSVPDGLFPDLSLHGAGMHEIPQGGYLRSHKDSEKHPVKPWFRKLNMVLFINSCEGGELVIENHEPISPKPGKAVIFSPNLSHEVIPVTEGIRMSLSLFWWSLSGEGKTTVADFSKDH